MRLQRKAHIYIILHRVEFGLLELCDAEEGNGRVGVICCCRTHHGVPPCGQSAPRQSGDRAVRRMRRLVRKKTTALHASSRGMASKHGGERGPSAHTSAVLRVRVSAASFYQRHGSVCVPRCCCQHESAPLVLVNGVHARPSCEDQRHRLLGGTPARGRPQVLLLILPLTSSAIG